MDTKISPISYKFQTKTSIFAYPKYFFTPNHWAHQSIWYEFWEQSNCWDSVHYISLRSETENMDTQISPISYKFKTKTAIPASPKYFFTPNHWAHESIWYKFWE